MPVSPVVSVLFTPTPSTEPQVPAVCQGGNMAKPDARDHQPREAAADHPAALTEHVLL